MSDGLRPLAAVAMATAEERARQYGDALASEAAAERAHRDATERSHEAERRRLDAAHENGTTAAERALNDARCARLRERAHAAVLVLRAAEERLARARREVEQARSALGSAHGERRAVEAALERVDSAARAARIEKEDDEADEIAQRPSSR